MSKATLQRLKRGRGITILGTNRQNVLRPLGIELGLAMPLRGLSSPIGSRCAERLAIRLTFPFQERPRSPRARLLKHFRLLGGGRQYRLPRFRGRNQPTCTRLPLWRTIPPSARRASLVIDPIIYITPFIAITMRNSRAKTSLFASYCNCER